MNPETVIKKFDLPSGKKGIHPIGSGHIHKTFRIEVNDKGPRFILQHLNTSVFKYPEELMNNALRISRHLKKKVTEFGLEWELINFIPSVKDTYLFQDDEGKFWRMFNYIPHVELENIDENIFFRAGEAYGYFIRMMSDLPPPPLFETIPHFHDLAYRLEEFEVAREHGKKERITRTSELISLVETDKMEALFLSGLFKKGRLRLRTTHNDAKIDNILFDDKRKVISVIDLDTVMPGIVHSDFGDAIRSFANSVAEDDPDDSASRLNLEVFTGFTRGFLKVLRETLTENEINTLVYAPSMFAFMQGLRFLNDYLMGDTYYKTKYEDHNLVRARNQFALYRSIKNTEQKMREIMDSFIQ